MKFLNKVNCWIKITLMIAIKSKNIITNRKKEKQVVKLFNKLIKYYNIQKSMVLILHKKLFKINTKLEI